MKIIILILCITFFIILVWPYIYNIRVWGWSYATKLSPPPPSQIKVYSVKGYLAVNKNGTILFFFNDKPIRSANHWVPQSMEENFIEIFETNIKISWEDEPKEVILEITTRQ